jgi:hypothetical protein
MDNKLIAILAVAIIAIAGIGVAAVMMNQGDTQVGVIYDGNGGKTSTGETRAVYDNDVAMINMFTNGDLVFKNYNTKADGTGTTYNVGDAVSRGMTLYAQWSEKTAFWVTSYSTNITSLVNVALNGNTPGMLSPVGPVNMITVTGGTGWTVNDNVFSCVIDGKNYTLTIKVTGDGVSGLIYDLDDNGLPEVGFKTTSDIGLYLSLKRI